MRACMGVCVCVAVIGAWLRLLCCGVHLHYGCVWSDGDGNLDMDEFTAMLEHIGDRLPSSSDVRRRAPQRGGGVRLLTHPHVVPRRRLSGCTTRRLCQAQTA